MTSEGPRSRPNIAIVGSTSPLGKELREILESMDFPRGHLTLLETEEYAGLLQEFAGEIEITQVISPRALEGADITFFTCGPEIINAYAASGAKFPDRTIDLTGAGRPGMVFLTGVSDADLLKGATYIVNPHPAVTVLVRALSALHRAFGVVTAAVTVLQPASERGISGVDELQEQAVSLLNFQPSTHKVFAGQLAFNLLTEAEASQRTEEAIRQQFRQIMSTSIPVPRITAVQASVFHSHAFSMFVELKSAPEVEQLNRLFENAGSAIALHRGPGAAPSPVSVVGSDKAHVARISADANHPGAYSIWMVADNLRIAAASAIQTAEQILFAASHL